MPTNNWQETLDAAQLTAGPELMVALDIDGTVVHYDTSMSPRVYDAIRAHMDAGTHIMLCTGRSVWATQIVLDQLGMNSGFAVSSNGAIIVSLGDSHPELDTEELPDAVLRTDSQPVRLWKSHTFDPTNEIRLVSEHIPQAIIAVESIDESPRLSAPFPEGELPANSRVVPLDELAVPNATRMTIRGPHMTAQELIDAVDAIGLETVEYSVGWSAWVDIAPPGISKATGLEDVRHELGLDRAKSVTIGDSGNDKEMLAWAGVGVAMGNSSPSILPFADTIGPGVEDDGVALVLEHLL